jgi:hypothetical protein
MYFQNRITAILLATFIALAIAQFPRVEQTDPPTIEEVSAPFAIETTLKRACYDCHSNETRWPWYSHVAPVSWLIARDVNLARKEINFSEWGGYYPVTRQRKLEWMGRALREGTMPPWSYRLMHPGARLTDADRAVLEQWVQTALSTTNEKSNK